MIGPDPLLIRSIDDLHGRNSIEHGTGAYEFAERLPKQTRPTRSTGAGHATGARPGDSQLSPLVLRRGLPFDLRINFAREFRKGEDLINLVFTVDGRRGDQEISGSYLNYLTS